MATNYKTKCTKLILELLLVTKATFILSNTELWMSKDFKHTLNS